VNFFPGARLPEGEQLRDALETADGPGSEDMKNSHRLRAHQDPCCKDPIHRDIFAFQATLRQHNR